MSNFTAIAATEKQISFLTKLIEARKAFNAPIFENASRRVARFEARDDEAGKALLASAKEALHLASNCTSFRAMKYSSGQERAEELATDGVLIFIGEAKVGPSTWLTYALADENLTGLSKATASTLIDLYK